MHTTPSQPQPVYLTSGTILRAILFILLFVFVYIVRDIVIVLLTAVVIASAIDPGVRWFERRRIPRVISVILVYLLTFMLLALGFYIFIPPLLSDVINIIGDLPTYTDSLSAFGGLPQPFASLSPNISFEQVVFSLQSSLQGLSSGVLGVASSVFGGLMSFLLIVVLSFYFSVQKDGVSNFLRIVTPLKHESYVIDLWRRSQRKIGRWLQGQLLLSLLVGILVYLGLMIIGVPNALVLGIIAAILELIPLFGPVLAGVPAIAVALIYGGTPLGLMTFLLYVIIQQFENHLLHPLVVNKVVGVPALIAILALIVGGKLLGFIGLILAVPLATILMEFTHDVEQRKKLQSENSST